MSHPIFEIKQAERQDVETVHSLIKELAEYEKLSHEMVATIEDIEEAMFGKRPIAEAVIGYETDQPVGFALFFHNFSTFVGKPGLYLEDLYVKPEYRGRGYGKRLLVHGAKIAKERGCGRYEWCVLDWNTPAIDFYKGLGAIAMDEWTTYRVNGEALTKLAQMES